MMLRQSILFLMLLLVVRPVAAQSVMATLRGTVHDPSGAAVPLAVITATNQDKGIDRTVSTNESGDYVIVQLPAQSYTISIAAPGFQTRRYDNFVLQVSQEARLDVTLAVGELATEVIVSERTPLVQSEDAVNGAVLDEQKIRELPINSRNFWQLAQLDPNVSPPTTGSSLLTRGGFIVAGVSDAANNYLLDGVDDNDWTTGQPTVRPSQDAIREFRIQTGLAPAEFGRRAGGQVELTTKSGTNDWHGTTFLFYRNARFNARNYFSSGTKPASESKQFGGSIGGPLGKDRTFVFGSYEGTFVAADPGVALTVPAEVQINAARSGDFSYLLGLARPVQLRNPVSGALYPNNQIPISPQSGYLLQYFPRPTVPGLVTNNFVNNVQNKQRNHQVSGRFDHVFSSKHNVSAVYTALAGKDTGTSGDFVATTTTPGFESVGPHAYQHISFTDLHIFSPTFLNEFRAGFNRMAAGYYNEDMTLGNIVGEKLGLPQGPLALQDARIEKCGRDECSNTGVPLINISGYNTIGSGNNPQWRGDNTLHLADGLTLIRGNHTLKFGGDYINFFKHSYFVSNGRGSFTFGPSADGVTSGDFWADFALGYFSQLSFGNGNTQQYPRQNSYSLFLQDAWKVSRALTLNYGLRYEYFHPHTERFDNISYFDTAANRLHTGDGRIIALNNANGLLEDVGSGQKFSTLYGKTPKNFAPRFGFAYRLNGGAETVVRGGYGVFYNLLNVSTWNSATALGAPFVLSRTFITARAAPLTWATPFAATVPVNSIAITTIDPDIARPYTQQWSLGVQHQIGNDLLVEVNYQGSKSTHYNTTHAINNPTLQARQANPTSSINALRPYNSIGTASRWGAISVLDAGASGSYNSVLVRAEKRYHNGLGLNSYVIFAKSLDNFVSPQNPAEPGADWGPSDFDQKLRSVTTVILDLPFGNGHRWNPDSALLNAVVSGWKVTGISTFQSGRPFTVTTSDPLASNTGAADRAFVVAGVDPTAATSCNGTATRTPQQWFNTCAFRANDPANTSTTSSTVFNFGTAGKNSMRGPGLQNIDLGVLREIKTHGENHSLQLRLEVFNVFNHPNFANPAANYGSPTTVGLITSTVGSTLSTATGANRQLQFGAKYTF
jgi:hypothetical protein